MRVVLKDTCAFVSSFDLTITSFPPDTEITLERRAMIDEKEHCLPFGSYSRQPCEIATLKNSSWMMTQIDIVIAECNQRIYHRRM